MSTRTTPPDAPRGTRSALTPGAPQPPASGRAGRAGGRPPAPGTPTSSLTADQLPRFFTIATVVVALAVAAGVLGLAGVLNLPLVAVVAAVVFLLLTWIASRLVEGPRRAKDRIMASLATLAFLVALTPLVSLIGQTVGYGVQRFDAQFFSYSMRNVVGAGGGAVHALWGTLIVTGLTTLISVPIGLLCAIYLVEYGARARLARWITFFVDVMTGIPSIVAGLFAYALFGILVGPGAVSGLSGAVALSVLMIPTVVRSAEEYLRLVPNELREASLALGVPKWRTVLRVVLPTALAGIVTGVILSLARVIGETAPLLVTMGLTDSLNTDPLHGAMTTLPVFVYYQYTQPGTPPDSYLARAWAGALTLVLLVMLLNAIGRLVAFRFAPKTRS